MKSALWAKLMTSIIPNTSVRPAARRMRLAPTVRPISAWVRIEPSDISRSRGRARGPAASRQLASAIRVRGVLDGVHHRRPQWLVLHDPEVEVLDGVVVLRI